MKAIIYPELVKKPVSVKQKEICVLITVLVLQIGAELYFSNDGAFTYILDGQNLILVTPERDMLNLN